MRSAGAAFRGFVACGSLATAAGAFAAHPFVTDDAGTQGKGHWQLELIAEHTTNSATADLGAGIVRHESRESVFVPVLTYGLLDNLDIALGGAHVRGHAAEDGAPADETSGQGDSSLELKWRFYEADGLSLALKPGITLTTGDENKGLGTGKTSWGATLILAYEAGPWQLLANVAYQRANHALQADRDASRADLWRVSAGFGYALADEWRLVGEAGMRTNAARDDPFAPAATAQFAMIGVIYSPADRIDLDVGIRSGLNRAEPDTTFLAGATFRW